MHVENHIVTEYAKKLDRVDGNEDPLTVTREKVHECIGMTVDFSLKLGVAFNQYDFVKQLWKNFSDDS